MNRSNDTQTWLWIGAKQGAKWGFLLALAYILWRLWDGVSTTLSASMLEQLKNGSVPSLPAILPLENIVFVLIFSILVMGGDGLVGGIATAVIGGVSGLGLGGLLSHHTIRPSPMTRFIVSAVFGTMGAFLMNLIGSEILLSARSYNPIYPALRHWHYIGLPSIVYIVVCLIMSQQLPLWVECAHAKESPIEPLPS